MKLETDLVLVCRLRGRQELPVQSIDTRHIISSLVYVPGGILSENIHWVVDLNVQVVTNIRQLLSLSRDDLHVLSHDLIRRTACLAELTTNEDALAVHLWLVCIFALVLERYGNFGDAFILSQWRNLMKNVEKLTLRLP